MTTEQFIALLAEHTGKNPADISEETTFASLGVDSLDTVDMLMNLEEQLGVELQVNEKINTVGEMVALLQSQLP